MPQAEHGYRLGMGAATGMQHLFVPYVYRGTGPFDKEPRKGGIPAAHGTLNGHNRHIFDGTEPCIPCQAVRDAHDKEKS